MIIKQYGLQRSGTNYIKALIEQNYDIRVMSNMYGKKHEKFDFSFKKFKNYNVFEDKNVKTDLTEKQFLNIHNDVMANNIVFLIIFKHPLKWIESYFRYKNRNNTKIITDCKDNFFHKSCIQWNEYHADWYKNIVLNNELKSFVVFYDILIKRQKNYMEALENRYHIDRLSDDIIDVNRKMWAGTDKSYRDININLNNLGLNNRKKYLNMKFISTFTSRQRSIMKRNIDFDLFGNLKQHAVKNSNKEQG